MRTNHWKQKTEECRIAKEMSCPQEAAHEHIGPCEFLLSVLLLFFICFEVTFYTSAFLLIDFSFFLLFSNFLFFSFLFTSYASVIYRIFPPLFRFLSPLIMKNEVTPFVVSCCFCCWFRFFSNKYNLPDQSALF